MQRIAPVIDWVGTHIPPWFWILLVVHFAILGGVAYMILLERKVASWAQDRIGPNRVGLGFGILPIIKNWKMFGLGQPLADGLKFIVKEDYRALGTDKNLFTVAPAVMIIVIIVSIAVIPWGGTMQASRVMNVPAGQDPIAYTAAHQYWGTIISTVPVAGQTNQWANQWQITYTYPFQIASLNIGVLFVLATLSLAVYGVVIGGWASNNKYSFLGGLRATANMISYEIPMGLAILCIVLMFGTLDMGTLVEKQCHDWIGWVPAWNCFTQPLAFIMFIVCIHAEANRAPFDTAEAEQELVGGYHTEYSAMRFALFFLAEYAGMVTTSAVCVALFLGGWDLPFIHVLRGHVDPNHPAITTNLVICIVRGLVFAGKTTAIIFLFMWVRWSLPRFRFDQIMMLAWRGLIPISLALLMMTAGVVYAFHGISSTATGWVGGWMALALFCANFFTGILIAMASVLIPPAPATNRRLKVIGSRYAVTPRPANLH